MDEGLTIVNHKNTKGKDFLKSLIPYYALVYNKTTRSHGIS